MPDPAPAREGALWRSFPIFGDLPPEALAQVSACTVRRQFRAGQVIFHKGDAGDDLLALIDGRIKLSILSPAGRELLVRLALPGDLVGEIACLDGRPRTTDATAATPCTALVLSRVDLQTIGAAHPSLLDAAIRHLAGLLRDTNDRLESATLHSLEARLARLLLFTLAQLHGEDLDTSAPLATAMTQGDIALMLGASRPKVNGALQALRDRGALVARDGGWLCQTDLLRAIAAGGD